MQQYFGIKKDNNVIYLNSSDLNHIKNVMRFKKNDKVIVVFDKVSYLCSFNKDLLSVNIIDIFKQVKKESDIIAYVPVLNDDKLSFIFQKGTELGITKFIPVEFTHCKYKFKNEVKDKKIKRWNKITKEAAEQSLRLNIPIVENIINYTNIISKKGVNILCSLDKNNVKPLNEVLNAKNVYDTISLVFGPEGGLTKEEENFLVSKGFIKTSLGNEVLRSETVILYLASIISFFKLGDKDE